jgi:hypothetical protein
MLMVLNATSTIIKFSIISWRSVLLVEGTGIPGENNRPVASHLQTFNMYYVYQGTFDSSNI